MWPSGCVLHLWLWMSVVCIIFSKISNQYLLIFKVEMFTYLEVILIIFYHFHTSESVTHKTWILVKKFVFDQMFFWTTFRWTCNINFFFHILWCWSLCKGLQGLWTLFIFFLSNIIVYYNFMFLATKICW